MNPHTTTTIIWRRLIKLTRTKAHVAGMSGRALLGYPLNSHLVLVVRLLLSLGFSFSVRAQQPGSLDPTFNVGTGLNGYGPGPLVQSIILEPAGTILVAGDLSSFNGYDENFIVRINSDGSISSTTPFETPLGVIPSMSLNSACELPDGTILCGGTSGDESYTTVCPDPIPPLPGQPPPPPCTPTTYVYCDPLWGVQGTNPLYALPFTSGSLVRSIIPDGPSSFIVAGTFAPPIEFLSSLGYTSSSFFRVNLARFVVSSDGILVPDTSFAPSIPSTVLAVTQQPDGKYLVGGSFTQPRLYVARLLSDGTLDATFTPQAPDFYVDAIAVQDDGRIIVGGTFGSTDGGVRERNHVARLLPNGALDATFNPSGTDNKVNALAIQRDGKILIGGNFSEVNGFIQRGIARLNQDGSLDTNFVVNANDEVTAIAIQTDSQILVGGSFTFVNGAPANGIARLVSGLSQVGVGALSLKISRSTAGLLTISWTGLSRLQFTETLNPPNWADVIPQPTSNTYTLWPAASAKKFFRISE